MAITPGSQWHDLVKNKLTHGSIRNPFSSTEMTHSQYADYARSLPSTGIYTRQDAERDLDRDVQERDEALRTPHENLIQHALRRHTGSSSSGRGFFGHYYDLAAGQALSTEIQKNSRPNPVSLYTGSNHHPADNLQGYHSFSESHDVAKRFADAPRGRGATRVYTAGPGSVRGIRVEDYGVPNYGDEQEWLVNSSSTRGLK
jgi:hypothetical protein